MATAKEELENLKKITTKKEKKHKELIDFNWLIKIIVITFILSFTFSFISESTLPSVNLIVGIILVIVFIGLGVLFDMIGVAVTSADLEPFNSMSSRKVKGSRTAVKFIQNADKVSSFCNDVIGDICGIISGSAGVIIATQLADQTGINAFLVSLLTTAIIAALTIGGKALGKSIAINKNNIILFEFAKIISVFNKKS